jgi:hypothetical protein
MANHRRTTASIQAALLARPGLTRTDLHRITYVSLPTIAKVLDRIAIPIPGTWPRDRKLSPLLADEIIRNEPMPAVADIPIDQGWVSWARATMSWPNAIGSLSRSTDPREIASGLAAMSKSAAALSNVFMQVSEEPNWLELIGGQVSDGDD